MKATMVLLLMVVVLQPTRSASAQAHLSREDAAEQISQALGQNEGAIVKEVALEAFGNLSPFRNAPPPPVEKIIRYLSSPDDGQTQIQFGSLYGITFNNISELRQLALSGLLDRFTPNISENVLYIIGHVSEKWQSQCKAENKVSSSGSRYPLTCDVTVAHKTLDGITGITSVFYGERDFKLAEFNERIQPTANGELLGMAPKVCAGKASFSLYDDGWRLAELNDCAIGYGLGR
jgi:hypothetical protein